MKKKFLTGLILFILLLTFTTISRAQTGFTQKDRELLIRLETKVDEMDKRFEQVGKRFSELRDDMNNRFEQVDKRIEQVDSRFGEMMTYIGILAAIFVAITVGTISFAFWDRRTMIRPFETKVAVLDERIIENREKHEKLVTVLKEYASKNKKFAETISQFNLF